MVSFVQFLRRTFSRRERHHSVPTPSFEERSPESPAPAEPLRRWYSLRARQRKKVGDLEAGSGRRRSGTFRRSWSLRISKRRSPSKSVSTSPDPDLPKADSKCSDGGAVVDTSNCSGEGLTTEAAGGVASTAQSDAIVHDCRIADSDAKDELLHVPAEESSVAGRQGEGEASMASPVAGSDAGASKISECSREGSDHKTDTCTEDTSAKPSTCSTSSSPQEEPLLVSSTCSTSMKTTVEVSVEESYDANEPTATRVSSSPCSEDAEVASESDGSDVFVALEKAETVASSDIVSPASCSTPSSVRARVLELEALSDGTPPITPSRQHNRLSMYNVQPSPPPAPVPKQRSRSESDTRGNVASPDGNGKSVRFEVDKEEASKKRKWRRNKGKKKRKSEDADMDLPASPSSAIKPHKKKSSSGDDEPAVPTVTRGSVWRRSGKHNGAATSEGGSEEKEKAGHKAGESRHGKRFFKVKRSQSEKVKRSHESTDGDSQAKSASHAAVSKDDLDIGRGQLSVSVRGESKHRSNAVRKSLQLDDCKHLGIITA